MDPTRESTIYADLWCWGTQGNHFGRWRLFASNHASASQTPQCLASPQFRIQQPALKVLGCLTTHELVVNWHLKRYHLFSLQKVPFYVDEWTSGKLVLFDTQVFDIGPGWRLGTF